MKVELIYFKQDKTLQVVDKLRSLLKEAGITIDSKNPDIVISIGGDGTLLSAFNKYKDQLANIRFLGIHTGRLGFYTDWREYEIEELVASLSKDHNDSVEYPLLEVETVYENGTIEKDLALNEVVINRLSDTLVCDLLINDEIFERFRGDGLCVSTPTGSTGYNKSLGGAVLHPRLKALQVAEIASLNNLVFRTLASPMVIAPDEKISIHLVNNHDVLLSVDNRNDIKSGISSINYKIAPVSIKFARYRHTHFWNRVEASFIGSRDELEK